MPDDRLAEYRAYYRSRAARAAANPLYRETAKAEKAMAKAVDAARSLEDLQATAQELALATGRALATDQATARARVYADTAETVRARGAAEALAAVPGAGDAPALVAVLAAIEQRTDDAVTVDELTRRWTGALTALENTEVWRTATVPDRWRKELEGYAADAQKDARTTWALVVKDAASRQPGWAFDPEAARAPRHRARVPLADAAFEQRLAEHATVVRGERA